MSEFYALSLLDVSSDGIRQSIDKLDALPRLGEQRIRVIVAPTHITLAANLLKRKELPAVIVSVAGYPTGRHHSLIKASEARLAVQSGAEEIWVSVDDTITDVNTHLSELVAICEACPSPIALGLIAPNTAAGVPAAKAAVLAGFKRIIAVQPAPDIEAVAAAVEFHVVDL